MSMLFVFKSSSRSLRRRSLLFQVKMKKHNYHKGDTYNNTEVVFSRHMTGVIFL